MKWNPVDQPPEKDGRYLVVIGKIEIAEFGSSTSKWYREHDHSGLPIAISHWMELPDKPQQ